MDPVQKIWMYENWMADQNDNAELAKNHAYLLGSFINPEMAKNILEPKHTHESTEEEFEESLKMIDEINEEHDINTGKKKKKRKKHNLRQNG